VKHDDSTDFGRWAIPALPSISCPDSVWEQLPGGPVAPDDIFGEVWQYTGTVTDDALTRYEFRHRSHPRYGGARVYAHVAEDAGGPPGWPGWSLAAESWPFRAAPGRRDDRDENLAGYADARMGGSLR
jgi:hypothetical protein